MKAKNTICLWFDKDAEQGSSERLGYWRTWTPSASRAGHAVFWDFRVVLVA